MPKFKPPWEGPPISDLSGGSLEGLPFKGPLKEMAKAVEGIVAPPWMVKSRSMGYGGLENTGRYLLEPDVRLNTPSPTGYFHAKTWDGYFAWDYVIKVDKASSHEDVLRLIYHIHFSHDFAEEVLKGLHPEDQNILIQFTPISREELEELMKGLPTSVKDFEERIKEDRVYPFD